MWGAGEQLLAEAIEINTGQGLGEKATISKEPPLFSPERFALDSTGSYGKRTSKGSGEPVKAVSKYKILMMESARDWL